MENASQALFMAAGVLIALLVISLGVYLFRASSSIGESYELRMSTQEIEKFNSKFSGYDKTSYMAIIGPDGSTKTEGVTTDKPGVFYANYNTISDVVSAINKAYDNNARKKYDLQQSIQVSVTFDNTKYYGISPIVQENNHEKNKIDNAYIYKISDIENKESTKSESENKELNDILKDYSECRIDKETGKTFYKDIFDGKVKYNDETGLIDFIIFTRKDNPLY